MELERGDEKISASFGGHYGGEEIASGEVCGVFASPPDSSLDGISGDEMHEEVCSESATPPGPTSDCISDFEMHASTDNEDSGMLLETNDAPDSLSEASRVAVDAPSDMVLDDCSDSEVPAEVLFEGGWMPGKNCGKFDSVFDAPLARVLTTNLFINLRRLPTAHCKNMLHHLQSGQEPVRRNFPDRAASALLGISHRRARRVHDAVRDNNWNPSLEEESVEAEGFSATVSSDNNIAAFSSFAPLFGNDSAGREKIVFMGVGSQSFRGVVCCPERKI